MCPEDPRGTYIVHMNSWYSTYNPSKLYLNHQQYSSYIAHIANTAHILLTIFLVLQY